MCNKILKETKRKVYALQRSQGEAPEAAAWIQDRRPQPSNHILHLQATAVQTDVCLQVLTVRLLADNKLQSTLMYVAYVMACL
jgi:hypothetical protein